MMDRGRFAREILESDDAIRSEHRVRFIYNEGTRERGVITLTNKYVIWEGRRNAWRQSYDDIPVVVEIPMGRQSLVRTENCDPKYNMQWLIGGWGRPVAPLEAFLDVGYVPGGQNRVTRA